MTRSKFDIEGAYARALREKDGALPTLQEVAALCGASVETARYHLKHFVCRGACTGRVTGG